MDLKQSGGARFCNRVQLSRLSPGEANDYRPFRLGVIVVKSEDTIERLARTLPLPDYQVARFQTLNGLPKDATLSPGQRVKIVTE